MARLRTGIPVPAVSWAALFAITAAGAVVRWQHLDGPMRYDESYTVVTYVSRGLPHVLANYRLPNNHVFHTLLVYGLSLGGGLEPWVVRLPAFLAGVAQIPLSFVVFSRICGRSAGIIAAAFAAGSSVLIAYSANARGYTIAGLLAVVAVGLAAQHREGAAPHWSLYAMAGVGALGLWTVPVFTYAWAGVLLWMLAPRSGTRFLDRFRDAFMAGTGSVVGAVLLYAPVLLVDGPDVILRNRFVAPDPWPVFVDRMPGFLRLLGAIWTQDVPAPVLWLVLFGIAVALTSRRSGGSRTLAWSLVAAVTGLTLYQHAIPHPRTWLLLLPLVLGIAAAGLATVLSRFARGRRADVVVAAGAVVLSLWLSGSARPLQGPVTREDPGFPAAEEITGDLVGRVDDDDYIAAKSPSTAPLRYHLQIRDLPPLLRRPDVVPPEVYVVTTQDQTVQEVLESVDLRASGEARRLSSYETGELWRVQVDAGGAGGSG